MVYLIAAAAEDEMLLGHDSAAVPPAQHNREFVIAVGERELAGRRVERRKVIRFAVTPRGYASRFVIRSARPDPS